MGAKIAESLIADMPASRAWWRLRAADADSLASRSGGSSVRWSRNRIEWVGKPWDGASALRVGEHAVAGGAIKRLLSQLKPKIEKLDVPSVKAPTAGDVRACVAGLAEDERLAIDVDFEDFILPIAIAATAFDGPPASLGFITEGVLRHVEAAARNREPIARREAALRRAVEETSKRIGAGCTPLWLRLDPAAFDERPDPPFSRHYKLVMTVLDDSLSSSPSLPDAVWTVADIRDHQRLHGHAQRRRKAALSAFRKSGSSGTMTETSLALVQALALDPFETLQSAHVARIRDPSGALHIRRWGCTNSLSWIEGVLRTSIQFPQGQYDDGELTMYGDHPDSLALACEGRPLTAIMDHPAFGARDLMVTSASFSDDGLCLCHPNHVIPVDDDAVA
ncbi:hypothetical protein [Sphingomonas faeni]|uniref:hypothetical protein n=1 Tax=Sphingomonas faeni TaxID=185950 RepID=UPI00336181B0